MNSTQQSSLSSIPTSIHGFDPRIIHYGSIFLLIVGTFGNIVSFIIFSFGTLRRSSTFRYLAILSLMDLVVLYSGLLDLFLMIEYGGNYSLRILSPITCRLHTFITYWSQHSSSWILSFISVDRAVATNFIKFARKFCTPRSAGYIVSSIVILIGLVNCHELIFLHLRDASLVESINSISTTTTTTTTSFRSSKNFQKRTVEILVSICDKTPWNQLCQRQKRDLSSLNNNENMFKSKYSMKKCEPLEGSRYAYVWDHVWEWIDVCLYAIIPFTVMSIGTFFIVYRVYYQQRRVFRSRRSNQNHSTNAVPNRAKSLFYLLFTLNILYFILVSPVVFVTTMLFRNPTEELAYPRLKSIIYLMQYGNHSLNFIFYGITSPPYRRTLCEWFEQLFPYLPQCCQRTIQKHSQAFRLPTELTKRIKTNNEKNCSPAQCDVINERTRLGQQESLCLVPRKC